MQKTDFIFVQNCGKLLLIHNKKSLFLLTFRGKMRVIHRFFHFYTQAVQFFPVFGLLNKKY